jgi:glutamyl-tRNA synthetase
MPTYHLANIVDDHLMETSHVIRGEEWLPSLPLHYLLYRSFGWEAPEFAHLPLILKPIGNGKLSKRDGDKMGFPVFPLEWKDASSMTTSDGYRENGFFPEAVVNFLALLGWNDGTDQELFSLEELAEKFDLNRVHKAGAKFDPEKNKWFNHQYLQKQSDESLAEAFAPILAEKGVNVENDKLIKLISITKNRVNFVDELWYHLDFFFKRPILFNEDAIKSWNVETLSYCEDLEEIIEKIDVFNSSEIERIIKEYANLNNINIGKIMKPLRASLVGGLKGPDLFFIMEYLGREEVKKRFNIAYRMFYKSLLG